jgi:hypothetical protein
MEIQNLNNIDTSNFTHTFPVFGNGHIKNMMIHESKGFYIVPFCE